MAESSHRCAGDGRVRGGAYRQRLARRHQRRRAVRPSGWTTSTTWRRIQEMADWLDDDNKPHPLRFERAFHGLEIISARLSVGDRRRSDRLALDRRDGRARWPERPPAGSKVLMTLADSAKEYKEEAFSERIVGHETAAIFLAVAPCTASPVLAQVTITQGPNKSPLKSTASRSRSFTSPARISTGLTYTRCVRRPGKSSTGRFRRVSCLENRSSASRRPVLWPRGRQRVQLLGHSERADAAVESRRHDGAHR